jgi:hypothetical protein
MTPDGRFVTFVASLVNVSATNSIYVWDSQTGSNTLVSASLNNSSAANGLCDSPVISSNGQFVAFVSTATNLVTNILSGVYHVYVRDLQAGATQLLDASTNGVGVDATTVPGISADGSVVVFDSANLLSDNRHLVHDVFTCNLTTGASTLVSASNPALSLQTPNGISGLTSFSVSSNGQFVAFYSDADDLAANDTNGCRDVFVRDLIAGTNYLVSVNTNGFSGDGLSTDPAISIHGHYVAFTSAADDLVPGDTNLSQDVFVRDLLAGTTTLVSVSTNEINSGNGDSFSPAISVNGRYVLFYSKASNLAAGSFGSGIENLFFHDLLTATTYPLTFATSGTGVSAAAMTPDGQSVAFIGVAAGSSTSQLYVWNSQSNALTYSNNVTLPSANFLTVAISPNGQKLAYLANSTPSLYVVDLVANTVTMITNGTFLSHTGVRFSNDGSLLTYAMATSSTANQNVYLYNLLTGTNLLISQNFDLAGITNANSDSPSISPDGRFIAYRSFATNIVPLDFNNQGDLFVYDVSNNATILASVNVAGNDGADDRSLKPVFSADGQTLFFESWAADLSGNDFNNASDIFALDLTALPSTIANGSGATNAASGFFAQLVPAGVFGPTPAISWPLAAGESYQVQYKTNLSDAVWLDLPGEVTFIGNTGYFSDTLPSPGQRFYRVVLSP